MDNKKYSVLFFLAIYALCFVLPLAASAIGQIATPIVIENAVSGQIYESSLGLFNSSSNEALFKLTPTGEVAAWMTFYSLENSNDQITEIKIPANSNLQARVRFQIPDATPNDTYEGKVTLSFAAKNSSEVKNGVSLAQQVSRKVVVNVTGASNPSGDVIIRPVTNLIPQGGALEVTASCYNSGNVVIKPTIELEIFKNANKFEDINDVKSRIAYLAFPYANEKGIIPSQTEKLPIAWQTGNLEKGTYLASVKVLLGDKKVGELRFPFDITDKAANFGAADISKTINGNMSMIFAIAIGLVLLIIIFGAKKFFGKRQITTN